LNYNYYIQFSQDAEHGEGLMEDQLKDFFAACGKS